jgi:hypothetical protein
MPSRRAFVGSVAAAVSLTAGCLDDRELIAQCASRGVGSGDQTLRKVAPIQGSEQIALGILVSEQAVTDDASHAVRVRDSDDDLVASVPLMDNRDMTRLDPADYPFFEGEGGELYAVPLGPPPVHGEYTVALVGPEGTRRSTLSIRFNCYADDGSLP